MYRARAKKIGAARKLYQRGLGHTVEFSLTDEDDVHVAAGLLKLYFFELSPPLLTYSMYDAFVQAQGQTNELARHVALRGVASSLPTSSRSVLLYMLEYDEHKDLPYGVIEKPSDVALRLFVWSLSLPACWD